MLITLAIIGGTAFFVGIIVGAIMNEIAYRKWRKTHG